MANSAEKPHVEFQISNGPDRLGFLCGLGEAFVQTYEMGMVARAVFFIIRGNQAINLSLISIGTLDETWVSLDSNEFSFRARVEGIPRDTQKILAAAFEREDQRAILAKTSVFVAGKYNPHTTSGTLWVSHVNGTPIKPVADDAVIWELKRDPETGVDTLV